MDPLSITASAFAIAGFACKVSKTLARCIRTMHLADRDARSMQMELSTFSTLLHIFVEAASSSNSPESYIDEESGMSVRVLRQGQCLIEDMNSLLDQIGFQSRGQLQTSLQRGLAKLKWYLKKKRLLDLFIQFNFVKTSMVAFVSLVGLKKVQQELQKFNEQLNRLREEQVPRTDDRFVQLENKCVEYRMRLDAFTAEVKAARRSCRLAAKEVRKHIHRPEAQELSDDLEISVRRICEIISDETGDLSTRRRRRHSTSRRRSRRPPSEDARSARPPPRRDPPEPSSPAGSSAPSLYPPSSSSERTLSPISRAILTNGPHFSEHQVSEPASESSEELSSTPPRYSRDFRNEPLPDQAPRARQPEDNGRSSDLAETGETSRTAMDGQGTYVNPENPQDRRRRLPDGKLSET